MYEGNELAKSKLANNVTTLATCWYIKLQNGRQMGFTNHDQDLIISGVTYLAKSGFTASAISSSSNLAIDNLDIEGVLNSDLIDNKDIIAGVYNHAEVRIFIVDYLDPTAVHINLRRGWLGEIKLNKQQFVAEIRGLAQAFTAKIGELYSPQCRAKFGDNKCYVPLEKYTFCGLIVTQVFSRSSFISDSLSRKITESGYNNDLIKLLSYGYVIFETGSNTSIKMEIKCCAQVEHIQLALALPYEIQVDDKFTVAVGCDKSFGTCCNVFCNAVNFRGEPHIPSPARFYVD
ncbi:conserved hypothetical protein [Alphaproteobacteria bacterium]